ncbi:MAG: PPOX class F420-dependent oxidoreductase [Gammaproteobacteria bacterium]|nr:PPOX class F420-dependent oxidoreductase [Gammaproteobacteria bacterium]MBT5601388.1 PPOX class F420-dependent oxidoreductase [Gammaproteobacteria bacterium]MBT6245537.1 PPOX class F420-dependent oxidoreductase [Gammaproteobacteria bacterium]
MNILKKQAQQTMIPDNEKYFSLATQKRDGSLVWTPVWFALDQTQTQPDYYVFSAGDAGKVKRIRNFASAQIAACDMSGKVHGKAFPGHAVLINDQETTALAYQLLVNKYGWQLRLTNLFSRLFGRYQTRQMIKISLSVNN